MLLHFDSASKAKFNPNFAIFDPYKNQGMGGQNVQGESYRFQINCYRIVKGDWGQKLKPNLARFETFEH